MLTEAASEKSESVRRVDLRFTSLGQYPEVFSILYSACRFGQEMRISQSDMVRLCVLVEGLLEWKTLAPGAQQSAADAALAAEVGETGRKGEDGADDDGCTEAASDVGSWLDDEGEAEVDAKQQQQ